jgi:uncharacterized membrane protein YdbT with pleckstrin-like domain
MSLAGYTSEERPEGPLTLRPTIVKTFLKGVIAIAVFSVFLQLSWANAAHYLIFLGIYFGFLVAFLVLRNRSTFVLGDESIEIKRVFRRPNSVRYQDIIDISVSQGFLARRFNCGTVLLILKSGTGNVKLLGGGVGESLEEVPNPQRVSEFISSKLSPYSSFVEP